MFRSLARKAVPAARIVGQVARPAVRRVATEAGEAADSAVKGTQRVVRTLEIPPWGLVGLGVAAAGFFGKVLHDDNLATRAELQATRAELQVSRKEFREDIKDLRTDIHSIHNQLGEMKADIKELSGAVSARSAPK